MPPAALPAPDFDPAAVHPEIGQVRQALAVADWPTIRDIWAGLDWDCRSTLAWVIGGTPNVEHQLRPLITRDPSDTFAATMLACRLIKIGWDIRTSARAQHVSREQFAQFHEFLCQAEQVLIDVTARDPGNVTAWDLRLTTARGLELGQAEARRRYDHAVGHQPHHLPAQLQLLQQLCPKWGGSFEQMHAFARDCMLAAPEGALNAVLVVDGHLERWIALDRTEREQYLRGPEVLAELREAAARSVLHPQARRTHGWVGAHNTFAMVFSLVGDYAAAATHFTAVGHLATEHPWSHFSDPASAFQENRDRALAKGTK